MATSVTYAARGTSATAAANEIVITGSTPPATTITFYSDNPNTGTDENGDLFLDSNGGLPDPDTWVMYNGTVYTFTYQSIGSIPQGDTKFPSDLWGKEVAKITLSNGTKLFFVLDGSGTVANLSAIANGNHKLDNVTTTPPPEPVCFCAGTEILTPSGWRRAEDLRAGDMVLNERGEARPLVWAGRTVLGADDLRAQPHLRPIRIPAGAIGPGVPRADLMVSPQHRVVIEGAEAELIVGAARVLVPAKHLAGHLAEVVEAGGPLTYVHLLCESHEILVSNGLPSESFQPARRTVEAMSGESRARLDAVIAALGEEAMLTRRDALPSLRQAEATALAHAVARRNQRALAAGRAAGQGRTGAVSA